MFKVYILKSKIARRSYVGFTNNLERRLIEHNCGNRGYMSRYKPWEVIYTEDFKYIIEAKDREKYLKSRSGRRYLRNIFEEKYRL